MSSNVSFKIRRPSPVSRNSSSGIDSSDEGMFKIPAIPAHLTNGKSSRGNSTPGSPLSRSAYSSAAPSPKRGYDDRDSSDEDEGNRTEDEIITGFDEFGVQRSKQVKKPVGPLVIAPLENRDWREAAKRRKVYVPDSARAAVATGADGSVGGLGTRDAINSGPQRSGLQFRSKDDTPKVEDEDDIKMEQVTTAIVEEETEDERAARFLLARASGADGDLDSTFTIPAVSTPMNETEAYKQDVEYLPESSSLADYERVPVSQFGAALLRGMGWKEGTGASKTGKGPVEPYLPTARPNLLGIGAKEKEVLDDGSKKKGKGKIPVRPEKRYIPVVKKEREGSSGGGGGGSGSGSGSGVERDSRGSSRRRSPSPSRYKDRSKGDAEYDDRNRDQERRRDGQDDDRRRDRDRDGRRDNNDGRDRRRGRDSRNHSPRDRNGHDERERDRDRDRRR